VRNLKRGREGGREVGLTLANAIASPHSFPRAATHPNSKHKASTHSSSSLPSSPSLPPALDLSISPIFLTPPRRKRATGPSFLNKEHARETLDGFRSTREGGREGGREEESCFSSSFSSSSSEVSWSSSGEEGGREEERGQRAKGPREGGRSSCKKEKLEEK